MRWIDALDGRETQMNLQMILTPLSSEPYQFPQLTLICGDRVPSILSDSSANVR